MASLKTAVALDRAHALFTMRVFAESSARSPLAQGRLETEAAARAARAVEGARGDFGAALDAAIGDAPDGAVRVVLAGWLVEATS